MASSPSNSVTEPDIVEQVITEFFAKSLHIILESRSPYVSSRNYYHDVFPFSPSPSSSSHPRHKWFNLALKDCPAALENFDLWRQSSLEPLVVDVILVRRGSDDPVLKSEKIVERWVVQYESRKSGNIPSGGRSYSSEIPSMYKRIYRRTMVMLRSLYATVRLLPAYKVFRQLNSSGQICPFSLSHKISSFVEPFTRAEDAEMKQFYFVPVDTHCGKFSLLVSYLPKLDVRMEPPIPISAQFIPDYVGSPTTARLRRLHSIPSTGSLPTYVSYTRRHSWSNDQGVVPSVSPSPSPTYSESRVMHYNSSSRLPSRGHLPDHKKNTSFDEYWPSPPFSPSSSPSPPTHLHGVPLQNSLSRSESAPVSIPLPRIEGNSGLPPPPPPLKSGKVESILQPKKKSDGLHIGMALQKILYSRKDEAGRLPGMKLSSCSSSRVPSRGSTLLDEFDDSEFTCPFAPDEDIADSCRFQPSDIDVHTGGNLVSGELIPVRSRDAVVGALVRLLKTAPPLRQDLSNSVVPSQNVECEVSNQGIQPNKDKEDVVKKTAADALKELKSYRQMREKLLHRQSESQILDVDPAEKSDFKGSSDF